MSPLGMLWHQLRYDARRARWWVSLAGLLLAVAAYAAWPVPVPDHWSGGWEMSLLLLASLVLGAVMVVQLGAPARADAFLGGKPVSPGARAASALALAGGVMLGTVMAVAALHLWAFDVPWQAVPSLVLKPTGMLGLWLLVAMAFAANASTLLAVLGLGLALGAFGVQAGALLPHAPLSRPVWMAGMALGVLLTLLCFWQGYRRRWHPGVAAAAVFVAASALTGVADQGPEDPGAWERLPIVRRGIGLMLDSVQVRPQATAAVAVEDGQRLAVDAPLVLWLRVTGAPADYSAWQRQLTVTLVREDGRTVRLTDDTEREILRSPVLAAAGRRWRGLVPREMTRVPVPMTVPDSVRTLLAAHAAREPGARVVRVEVNAELRLFRQREVVRVPYQGATTWRAAGTRGVIRHTRDSAGVPVLEVTARELQPWLEREGSWRSLGEVGAYAFNAAGTEAVRLPDRTRASASRTSILPNVEVAHRTVRLRPDAESGLPADDPWFAGAQLLLLGWERIGTATVSANHVVPPG